MKSQSLISTLRLVQEGKRRRTDGSWAESDESEEAREASFFDPPQDGVFRAVPTGPRGGRVRILKAPETLTDRLGLTHGWCGKTPRLS